MPHTPTPVGTKREFALYDWYVDEDAGVATFEQIAPTRVQLQVALDWPFGAPAFPLTVKVFASSCEHLYNNNVLELDEEFFVAYDIGVARRPTATFTTEATLADVLEQGEALALYGGSLLCAELK